MIARITNGCYKGTSTPQLEIAMTEKKKIKKSPILTPRQKRELRALGHHLKPAAMLGREGITDNVIASVEAILAARELLKVKLQEGCPVEREAAADALSLATGAAVAQLLGRTILLYRPNPDLPADRRIPLPKN
jgi:RNA-binding protein